MRIAPLAVLALASVVRAVAWAAMHAAYRTDVAVVPHRAAAGGCAVRDNPLWRMGLCGCECHALDAPLVDERRGIRAVALAAVFFADRACPACRSWHDHARAERRAATSNPATARRTQ